MSKSIQAIRGMHDLLPDETGHWQHLEYIIRDVLRSYGYREIRPPIVEKTELFKRTIGEVTDIVEKEMYTFEDRNGDSLSLRPEGTAGGVRAGVEHGLLYNQIQRFWYMGPMFRHERPQKGRYRQFHQLGVEAFGMPGPDVDAELILMTQRLWRRLGITGLKLQINSLGSAEARHRYRDELVRYMDAHSGALDEDSRRRLQSNPLRILDSKIPMMQPIIQSAPKLVDYLDEESIQHFAELLNLLDVAGISYEVNPCLVRGLDYYGRTVFEWVTDKLGAQGTVCAGGRYDGLVEQLGGKATPAVGFALGIERLLALLAEDTLLPSADRPDCYMVLVGEGVAANGLVLAERLRDAVSDLNLVVDCSGGGFKAQLKKADKSGARLALILGEDEIQAKTIGIKYLRENRDQETLTHDVLAQRLKTMVAASTH